MRCQDADLPCSYLELRELHESGRKVPRALGMNRAQLATLVGQLDQLNAFAEAHRDVGSACAEGFVSDQIQTANMGSHFYKPAWIADGFDPSRPEILLYALADGTMPDGPVGQCVDGVWTGEHATALLRELTGDPNEELHIGGGHFWPYGLNYASEWESDEDLINHCLMVQAILIDMEG